jgi:hypothetical protein
MVVKDWKKMPSDEYWMRWRDDKRQKEIEIYPVGSMWQITTNEFTRYAKTRKEAIKFAENYMKNY